MKLIKRNSIQALGLGLLLALSVSTPALAAGAHAGGHSHDVTETAIGQPGLASKVSRTLQVSMRDDMRYSLSDIQVMRSETIRFVLSNDGLLKHEFSLGTPQELAEHYEQMKKFPDMEHDEPNKVSLAPGKKGEVIWHFTRAGTVDFACLHPGHFEAGMKGQIKVSAPESVQASALSEGEVRRIDKETGKVTLRHGEIKNLDMPPMTMVFVVRDPALLDSVQVGDKVRFVAISENKQMVVTRLQLAK